MTVERTLIENIAAGPGRPPRHRAGLVPVEDRIDTSARSGGAGRIRAILDQFDVIAGSFDPDARGRRPLSARYGARHG